MVESTAMGRWIKVLAVLVGVVLMAGNLPAAENRAVKSLSVISTAVVHNNDLISARSNAVEDALSSAVGQVVVGMLSDHSVVRRFKVINDNILAKRKRYVQNYRVLTESVSGNTIRTLVQVDVTPDRIRRDLRRFGVTLSGASYPRVLFMMAEKDVEAGVYATWWGADPDARRTHCGGAMAKAMREMGFGVVAAPQLTDPLGLPDRPTKEQMVSLARRLGADVLIAGDCTAGVAANTMAGAVSAFEATVAAEAFMVKSGTSVGHTRQQFAVSAEDVASGGREALAGAGELAADELSRGIMTAWQQRQDRRAAIEVMVEGTGGHIASFVRLRTAISTLSGVKEVKMREMSGDLAIMAVNYQGSARSLADALLLKSFKGFGIDIYEVAGKKVRIRLIHD